MDVSFALCTIFLSFLLLCRIHGNLGREVPKEAQQKLEATYKSQQKVDDHLCLNNDDGCHMEMHAHPSTSHLDHIHIDPAWNILFHLQDLKLGQKIPLYFPITNSSQSSHLIPQDVADSIPFSSTQLPEILEFFNFSQDSTQAKAIKQTLNHCELPPLQGETKFCATSLESMLLKLGQLFGNSKKFRIVTTTQIKNWTPHLQNYTIVDEPKEIAISKMFGCHPMPYPYAVFYCHGQEKDNRLFMLSLQGEDGLRVEAASICHMDTSHWDPEHASFRMLGVEPGMPVCHVFPQNNLVWLSSPGSVN